MQRINRDIDPAIEAGILSELTEDERELYHLFRDSKMSKSEALSAATRRNRYPNHAAMLAALPESALQHLDESERAVYNAFRRGGETGEAALHMTKGGRERFGMLNLSEMLTPPKPTAGPSGAPKTGQTALIEAAGYINDAIAGSGLPLICHSRVRDSLLRRVTLLNGKVDREDLKAEVENAIRKEKESLAPIMESLKGGW